MYVKQHGVKWITENKPIECPDCGFDDLIEDKSTWEVKHDIVVEKMIPCTRTHTDRILFFFKKKVTYQDTYPLTVRRHWVVFTCPVCQCEWTYDRCEEPI